MSGGEAHDGAPERPNLETVFRETFLFCFTEPEHVALLRQIGRAIYDIAMESPYWDWGASHGLGAARGDATAAATDLEDLAGYLQRIAEQPAELGVAGEDLGICRAAEGWAGRVRRLVADIREELGGEELGGEEAAENGGG